MSHQMYIINSISPETLRKHVALYRGNDYECEASTIIYKLLNF